MLLLEKHQIKCLHERYLKHYSEHFLFCTILQMLPLVVGSNNYLLLRSVPRNIYFATLFINIFIIYHLLINNELMTKCYSLVVVAAVVCYFTMFLFHTLILMIW
jgi:hypothetical protein